MTLPLYVYGHLAISQEATTSKHVGRAQAGAWRICGKLSKPLNLGHLGDDRSPLSRTLTVIEPPVQKFRLTTLIHELGHDVAADLAPQPLPERK